MIRRMVSVLALIGCCVSLASAQTNVFFEDFQGLTSSLQVAIDAPNGEGASGTGNVDPDRLGWTHTAPAGWLRDAGGVPTVGDPNAGVAEWEGWSFATLDFWVDADDQRRSEFQASSDTATNIVAVADPDEWDDWGSPADTIGLYNTNLFTPAIDVSGVDATMLEISFNSSWRDECCDDGPITGSKNDQTAVLLAAYDGVPTEILRWQSDPSSPFFKDDAPDEFISLALGAPAGTQSVAFAFQMQNAGNDWWWAIDNISVDAVPEPASASFILTALLCGAGLLRRRDG